MCVSYLCQPGAYGNNPHMPTKPADRTSSVARLPSDFESQLQLLAVKTSPLHLVPAAVTDATTQAPLRQHGPWDPQQCATILLRWLDADLVVVLVSTSTTDGAQMVTESRQLPYDEARDLLAAPHQWSPPTPPEFAVHLLCSADRAVEVDDDAWWSAARAGGHDVPDGGNASFQE